MRRNKNFTLVELLAVIAIVSLLTFIALPSFTKMLKGHGAELAGRTLTTKLNMSRSYAISKRKYVALLMPQVGNPSGANIPSKYLNCSYRTCIVEKNNTDNKYYFHSWIPGEAWEFLPTGTAILEVDEDNGVNLSGTQLAPANGTITTVSPAPLPGTSPNRGVNCTDIGGSSSVTNFAAVIFKPTGGLADGGSKYIEIGEAIYSPGTLSLILTNKGNLSYVSVSIDNNTGRICFENR